MRTTHYVALSILLLVVGILSVVASVMHLPLEAITHYIESHRGVGVLLFTGLMFLSTVIAPLMTLPLVPLVAPILGPTVTALASIIGWTLGAIVAFLIARYGGRPLLSKYIALETLERYESTLPKQTHFFLIVMMRMMIPVDVLSYALGFISTVGILEYTLATLIGVSWFSFAFAYFGEAFFSHNYVLLGGISVASVIILLIASWYVRSQKR